MHDIPPSTSSAASDITIRTRTVLSLKTSLENVSPIHIVENTLYYETVVETLTPGWYGVLVASTHNETAEYNIEFEPVLPYSGLFVYGLAIVSLGIVLIATTKILERRRSC